MAAGDTCQIQFTDASGFLMTLVVTENADGTLTFDLEVDESTGQTGDVRAIFLNNAGDTEYTDLQIASVDPSSDVGAEDVDLVQDINDVRKVVENDTNVNGGVINENGGRFDTGIEFGASGIGGGRGDVQSMSFVVSADESLTLESFDLDSIGLRVTSTGDVGGDRDGSLKLTGEKVVPELGSLSGRYFCDDDGDGLDNDGPDNGIEGVEVILLNADGAPTGASTTTAPDGTYQFTDLEPGVYGVRFIDAVSGKELTTQNVDGDASDDIDSDAEDLGGGVSEIQGIEVLAGQDTPDNDAGVVNPAEFALEKDFVFTDEDTPLDFNVLDNDTASAGAALSVFAAGQGEIGFEFDVPFEFVSEGGRTGVLEISQDGSVSFDPASGFEDLNSGDTDLILFTYAAVDSNGNIDAADVVITVNGVDDLIV